VEPEPDAARCCGRVPILPARAGGGRVVEPEPDTARCCYRVPILPVGPVAAEWWSRVAARYGETGAIRDMELKRDSEGEDWAYRTATRSNTTITRARKKPIAVKTPMKKSPPRSISQSSFRTNPPESRCRNLLG